MYIVRVDFKNGLHAECNYGGTDGLGRAQRCRETVVAAMNLGTAIPPKQAVCEVYDDAGRQYNWDGAQVQSVGLIDLESETIAAIRIKQFVTALARKHDPDAFRQQPQVDRFPEEAVSPDTAWSVQRPGADAARDRRRAVLGLMIPLRIDGANRVFRAPPGSTNCRDLHVRFDASEGTCISRWEPTPEELEILKAGGSVELWVCGNQPPVYIGVAPLTVDA